MTEKKSRDHGNRLGTAIAILILVVSSPLVLIGVLFYALSGLILYLAIWLVWCLRGRYVLFVYSDSPIWREYIEREVLPRLEGRAVVLNWSERKRWRRTLAVFAFRYFGGYRAFNPLAVVFRPFHFAKTFRFFGPFQEFKHGKSEQVQQMQNELFELLRAITSERPA